MEATYSWKIPKYKAVSAQEAGEHIEELDREHGGVTPRLLLDDSRPEEAVLHPLYEWDDQKAAEKYRLDQSRDIISNLVLVRVESDTGSAAVPRILEAPVRAFTSVETDGRRYVGTPRVLRDKDLYSQAMAECRRAMKSMQNKYKDMGVFQKTLREMAKEEGLL